ncbi:MAG: Sua5/YciO/YrdC/YwlC family protein [Acidobacteriota bacterium]|nr:Sua5/YciO/YrdC/YwlC family protein [Acidobacteriota bacterium]
MSSAAGFPPAQAVPRWHPGEPLDPLRELLRRGGIIAVPTESSYGLAVDPCNPRAVRAVYELKGRPASAALPVAVAHRDQLESLGIAPDAPGLNHLLALWPAALTAVLPLAPGQTLAAADGAAGTVAVRIPDHPLLRRLLEELGPLTVTSANRSGEAPVTDPDAAAALLAGWDGAVVDDGALAGGPPSTLVQWRGHGWAVLRSGRFDPAPLLEKSEDQEGREL